MWHSAATSTIPVTLTLHVLQVGLFALYRSGTSGFLQALHPVGLLQAGGIHKPHALQETCGTQMLQPMETHITVVQVVMADTTPGTVENSSTTMQNPKLCKVTAVAVIGTLVFRPEVRAKWPFIAAETRARGVDLLQGLAPRLMRT